MENCVLSVQYLSSIRIERFQCTAHTFAYGEPEKKLLIVVDQSGLTNTVERCETFARVIEISVTRTDVCPLEQAETAFDRLLRQRTVAEFISMFPAVFCPSSNCLPTYIAALPVQPPKLFCRFAPGFFQFHHTPENNHGNNVVTPDEVQRFVSSKSQPKFFVGQSAVSPSAVSWSSATNQLNDWLARNPTCVEVSRRYEVSNDYQRGKHDPLLLFEYIDCVNCLPQGVLRMALSREVLPTKILSVVAEYLPWAAATEEPVADANGTKCIMDLSGLTPSAVFTLHEAAEECKTEFGARKTKRPRPQASPYASGVGHLNAHQRPRGLFYPTGSLPHGGPTRLPYFLDPFPRLRTPFDEFS